VRAWPTAALGDIFEIARGGSPRPIDDFITADSNGINWIMIGDAAEASKYITSTKKRIRPEGARRSRQVKRGDLLLTNSMTFGKPYIMRTEGCIHDGWLVLSPRGSDVDADFFYYLLGSKTVYSEFERRASGATVKNLNIDLVGGVTVSLPPLPEQRRIAEILDKADALRAKRRAALAQLDTLTQSIFLDMFGDPATNSKGWRNSSRLGDVAEVVSGVTIGRNLARKETRTIPYLAVANVQDRRLNLGTIKTTHATEEEIERYRLRRDDLLLTEGGDPDKLGRGTLWGDEVPECIHQNHVFRVRLRCADVTPLFLNWLVGSERGKRYFLRSAKQTTGIASINMTQLRAFPLLTPPLALQTEFGRRVTEAELISKTMLAATRDIDGLFASLQHRAFRGEL
jgi:type I restriction enzyme S subunit